MPEDNPFAPTPHAHDAFANVDVSPVPLEPNAVANRCMELIKAQPQLLIGASVLSILPSYLLSGVRGAAHAFVEAGFIELSANTTGLMSGGLGLIELAVSTFLTLGLLRIFLNVAYGQHAELSMLVGEVERFPAAAVTYLIVGLASVIGFLFFILPGLVVVLAYSFAVHLQLDRNLGVVDSLQASYQLTDGHKGTLFGLGLMLGLLVGVVSCATLGIAGALTGPLFTLASAVVYQSLAHHGHRASSPF